MTYRHESIAIAIAIASVLAVAGCNRIDEPASQTPVPTTAPSATTAPDDSTPAATTPATMPDQASQGGADLGVGQSDEYGDYLVDASGRSLYLLEKDTAGASLCYDACSSEWPPLLSMQGMPRGLDPAVKAGSIGTLQRTDGSMQVTYNGHPLYHYAKDTAAGQTNGQDVQDEFGEWYLVTPTGEAAAEH